MLALHLLDISLQFELLLLNLLAIQLLEFLFALLIQFGLLFNFSEPHFIHNSISFFFLLLQFLDQFSGFLLL